MSWVPCFFAGLIGLALAPAAWAQQVPHVGYVCPAGARQGSALLVVIGGQYLDGVASVLVSGQGVQAKVVESFKPVRQGQLGSLVERLKKLQEKKSAAAASSESSDTDRKSKTRAKAAWTAEDEMLLAAVQKKTVMAQAGPPVPAISDTVLVALTLAPNAEVGRREIRLQTPKGLTNPLVFCVGQLPESGKEPPKLSDELLSRRTPRYRDEAKVAPPAAISRTMPRHRSQLP